MKKAYTIALALVVLLSITMSASALESKTIYRQNGVAAYASWSESTADSAKYTYLSVTKTDDGTDVYLEVCTSDPNGGSCKWGYKFMQENVFEVDRKLETASLSEVQIDLYDWYSSSVETTTIKAQWTGVGDIMKGSYRSSSKYGDYSSKYSESSSGREAKAVGTLGGKDLGTGVSAMMIKFKSASMFMEK